MTTPHDLLHSAMTHHAQGRLREAELLYRQELAANPHQPEALHWLGLIAHQAGHHADAAELIGRAVRLQPTVAGYFNNLGEALRSCLRLDEAEAAYLEALKLDPRYAEAHNNLGTTYQHLGRWSDALACYERALALKPDYANAHYNRAFAWLIHGDFERGWAEYEWRWRRGILRYSPVAQPAWDGTPLAGRRLLARAEQGLGDTLQFIRYVPHLQSQGHDVVVEVPRTLLPLLTQSGIGPLVAQGAALPEFDVHVPLLSLPHRLNTTLDRIPNPGPYLRVSEQLRRDWTARLGQVSGFRVGICWQGNPTYAHDRMRSIPLRAFAPLAAVPRVRLISLQKQAGVEQLAALAGQFSVVDLRPDYDVEEGAFLNAAAAMHALDLVITTDTAIAHLAGGLGVCAWVLLSTAVDWRWLLEREDSPWYPGMRLFRQTRLDDWDEVMQRVAAALREEVTRPPAS